MNGSTIAREWNAWFSAHGVALEELLSIDPFEDWELSCSPEMLADMDLANGLNAFYGDESNRDIAGGFWKRVVEMGDRALREKKLESPNCRDGIPLNRARLSRAKSYAQALLDSEWPSGDDLVAVSLGFEEWCKGYSTRDWDSQSEAYLLAAVRTALIAGDRGRSLSLLETKKRYRWHEMESKFLYWLARGEEIPPPFFGEWFDALRGPSFRPDIFVETDVLRLEVAALLEFVMGEAQSFRVAAKRVIIGARL